MLFLFRSDPPMSMRETTWMSRQQRLGSMPRCRPTQVRRRKVVTRRSRRKLVQGDDKRRGSSAPEGCSPGTGGDGTGPDTNPPRRPPRFYAREAQTLPPRVARSWRTVRTTSRARVRGCAPRSGARRTKGGLEDQAAVSEIYDSELIPIFLLAVLGENTSRTYCYVLLPRAN